MSLEAPPAARRHSGMPPSNDQPHREFYSLHYIESWGPLKCVDHELYSLPDVVRVVMSAQGLPHIDAAKVVLRRVLDNPATWQLRNPVEAPGISAASCCEVDTWRQGEGQEPTT